MGKRVSLDLVRFIVTANMAAAIRAVVHIRKYSMLFFINQTPRLLISSTEYEISTAHRN